MPPSSGYPHGLVPELGDELELATQSGDITLQRADLGLSQVPPLDGGHPGLVDLEFLRQLRLRHGVFLAQLAQTVGPRLRQHPLFVRFHSLPIRLPLRFQFIQSRHHSHLVSRTNPDSG